MVDYVFRYTLKILADIWASIYWIVHKVRLFLLVARRRSRFNCARRGRERAGALERPPAPHCAAEETSQAFDDVGMKWQKLLLSRKRRDSVTWKLDFDFIMSVTC